MPARTVSNSVLAARTAMSASVSTVRWRSPRTSTTTASSPNCVRNRSVAWEAALSGAVDVLTLTDRRGKRVAVPAAKIAYVELGPVDGDRRIGFGS